MKRNLYSLPPLLMTLSTLGAVGCGADVLDNGDDGALGQGVEGSQNPDGTMNSGENVAVGQPGQLGQSGGELGGAGVTPGDGTGAVVDPACPKMCEVEVVTVVEVEGGGSMCTEPAYNSERVYATAGIKVSYKGKEYESHYYVGVGLTPAENSGEWKEWYPGVDCPSGPSTEEVVTKEMVCCQGDVPVTTPDVGTGCALDPILGESRFNNWFSARRNAFYTYANLCTALESFPAFASGSDVDTNKREISAFLANVARETGELDYLEEINKTIVTYYGRGPLQISHASNYESLGEFLNVDLLGNPDLLITDGVLTWKSALWFWMKADNQEKGTCHDAIIGSGGFGQTIREINGGLECSGADEANGQRIAYYRRYTGELGVDPGSPLICW